MEAKNSEQWHSKLFRLINSAICFSLAYILFTYINWYSMALMARAYKFDSFIYYYGIKFMMNSYQWDKYKITLIYSAGPVFALLFGLFCFFLYNVLRRLKTLLNVFLLWCFVVGTGMFVAQAVLVWLGHNNFASPYYQNLTVIFAWWKVPVFVEYLLCIPFAILFFYFTINYGRSFLVFSYSFSKVNKLSRRRKFFFETAIAPFALGAFITTFLTYPMNLQVHTVYLSTIGVALLVAWYLLSYIQVLKFELVRYKSLQNFNVIITILFALACMLVIITYRGIYFSG